MTTPQDRPQGVDASEMPAEAYQGVTVGNLLGLLVGSGAPPNVVSTPAPLTDADQFALTKPVNATQLTDELSTALQRSVQIALTGFDPSADISEANQATLWISPSGFDPTVIQTVIDNHEPFANYGESAEDTAFSTVMSKLSANETLTLSADELQTVVRGLAKWYRISNQSTTPEPSFTPSSASA